jgi:DNA-binding response OmpR family regulator
MRLLLLEDDAVLGTAANAMLTQTGVAVDWAQSVAEFEVLMKARSYDCVLLDLKLPDGDGTLLLEAMRTRGDNTPVIVLTAQWQGESSASLLNLGADDYLVKPYDARDLLARIRAVLRRAAASEKTSSLSHGPLVLHLEARVAVWHGELVPLTKKEYWLLEVLLRQRHKVLSRTQIESALYGWGEETDSNTVEVYIHHLRKKFSNALIVTQRGLGYRLGNVEALGA